MYRIMISTRNWLLWLRWSVWKPTVKNPWCACTMNLSIVQERQITLHSFSRAHCDITTLASLGNQALHHQQIPNYYGLVGGRWLRDNTSIDSPSFKICVVKMMFLFETSTGRHSAFFRHNSNTPMSAVCGVVKQ